MQDLGGKMYNFSNETNIELKMDQRAESRYPRANKVGYLMIKFYPSDIQAGPHCNLTGT